MDARERAARLSWATCPGGPGHEPDDMEHAYSCPECNAAAIRAAENEALENAAEIAEAGSCDLGSCAHVACIWGHDAAEDIRSLKTKETP